MRRSAPGAAGAQARTLHYRIEMASQAGRIALCGIGIAMLLAAA